MSLFGQIAVVAGVVFTVNLLPAFGPPTWAVLVYLDFQYEMPLVPLVLVGALAASCGRLTLAHAFRQLGYRLPQRRRVDLEAIGATLIERRGGRWGGLGLFLVSPLPSTQLFEAAGLSPKVPLLPVTAAFFCGRLVTYPIYLTGAAAAETTLRSLLNDGFASPWVIALQLLLVALLVGFVLTPWARILGYQPAPKDG